MYNNRLAVALKSAGKVLREFKDTVYVPFGSEYTLLIKNLNSVRARVTISIDGTDATENASLIIDANDEAELTRFIKNGNLASGNRFKFIERTAQIEEHRGVGITDGLIRVEFEFEQEKAPLKQWNHRDYWNDKFYGSGGYCGSPRIGQPDILYCQQPSTAAPSILRSRGMSTGEVTLMNCAVGTGMSLGATAVSASAGVPGGAACMDSSFNETGITVPGSVSDQKFTTVYGFIPDGVKHSIVLKLLGENPAGQPIQKPITVELKPTCVTCGTINKLPAKFCSNCGTALVIL